MNGGLQKLFSFFQVIVKFVEKIASPLLPDNTSKDLDSYTSIEMCAGITPCQGVPVNSMCVFGNMQDSRHVIGRVEPVIRIYHNSIVYFLLLIQNLVTLSCKLVFQIRVVDRHIESTIRLYECHCMILL